MALFLYGLASASLASVPSPAGTPLPFAEEQARRWVAQLDDRDLVRQEEAFAGLLRMALSSPEKVLALLAPEKATPRVGALQEDLRSLIRQETGDEPRPRLADARMGYLKRKFTLYEVELAGILVRDAAEAEKAKKLLMSVHPGILRVDVDASSGKAWILYDDPDHHLFGEFICILKNNRFGIGVAPTPDPVAMRMFMRMGSDGERESLDRAATEERKRRKKAREEGTR